MDRSCLSAERMVLWVLSVSSIMRKGKSWNEISIPSPSKHVNILHEFEFSFVIIPGGLKSVAETLEWEKGSGHSHWKGLCIPQPRAHFQRTGGQLGDMGYRGRGPHLSVLCCVLDLAGVPEFPRRALSLRREGLAFLRTVSLRQSLWVMGTRAETGADQNP